MMRKRSKVLLATFLAAASVAAPAYALLQLTWKDGCAQGMSCDFDICWCEGDWNDVSMWSSAGGGWPDASNERALFNRGNTQSCADDGTEDHVFVNLPVDAWFAQLFLDTENGSDDLRIAFKGAKTLTVWGYIKIDAEQGAVRFEVAEGAAVVVAAD